MGVVIWKLSHHVATGPSNICAANLTFSSSVQPTVTKSLFIERSQSLATIGSVVPENFAGLSLKNLVSMSKPVGCSDCCCCYCCCCCCCFCCCCCSDSG